MNRIPLISLCASTLCAGIALASSPVSAFATVNASSMSEKGIVFNQAVVSKPYGFVRNNTTYLPIWYLMQALNKLQIQSTWKNHIWGLTTSGAADLNHVQAGSGPVSIEVNGQLVQKINDITAIDPASGKATTYMPAWYIMQVLNRLQTHSKWNGTVWQIYTSATAPAIGNLDIQPNLRPPVQRSMPSVVSDIGQQLVDYAKRFIGVPYRWGGISTSGFDCSGLVRMVFQHLGISLPRTSSAQAGIGHVISKSDLAPGDLVFFNTGGGTYSHVGIYVGSNKFISATTSRGVQIRDLNDPYYWGSRFTCATSPGL